MQRESTTYQKAMTLSPGNRPLPDHPGRNEIMLPVLLVAFLAEMRCQLGPVADAVQQRMNKDLAAAGGEFTGRVRGKRENAVPVRVIGGDGETAQVFKALAGKREQLFSALAGQPGMFSRRSA
jgi:hypothetical protein